MEALESVEREWPYLLSFLPQKEELDHTARQWGAIERVRAVDCASTLIRLALVYGFCGYSLRQTAAWAQTAEVASLSDVALLKRFRKAPSWLGHLLGTKLAERVTPLEVGQSRLRLVDATTVSAPGSRGTDWRVHLDFDLARLAISEIQLTQASGGESLLRYEFEPGEIVVADRGYAHRSGLAHVVAAGADFLVRLNWATVPLRKRDGQPFELVGALRELPEDQAMAFDLETVPYPKEEIPALPVRLVALRKSEKAAEHDRKQILQDAAKKRQSVQPQTLELASYMLLLTSTREDQLSPEQVLETYRFRWQIELVFKRLKSLLRLDDLPARDPELARTALFAKLLGALLLEQLTQAYLSLSPWGYRLRPAAPTLALASPERAAG